MLSFHFIRLSNDNYEFWRTYAMAMRRIAHDRDFAESLKRDWALAVVGFLDALECYEENPASEVWIAAAAFGPISRDDFARSAVDIEMCMTVTTHREVPFTTHMGIFRSPLRRLKISSLNPLRRITSYRIPQIVDLLEREWCYLRSASNLSGQLHAFAAKRCLQECRHPGKKLYMINAPLKKMAEILTRKFEVETVAFDEKAGIVAVGTHKFDLGRDALEKFGWLAKLLYFRDPRHYRLAIDIKDLAGSSDERARVEAILDWLEKWA
jgi:hypothetical protein